MSRSFLWSAVVVISLLGIGGVAAAIHHSAPAATFATPTVSIDPYGMQATIDVGTLPEQQCTDLI